MTEVVTRAEHFRLHRTKDPVPKWTADEVARAVFLYNTATAAEIKTGRYTPTAVDARRV